MGKIKGQKVIIWEKREIGVDGFGAPTYEEIQIEVENVLIASPTADDISTALNLYGKKIEYILGIPKGDSHAWEDRKISFFGKDFRSIGFIEEGIEKNIPLSWHKKIKVVRYE